jgi:NADH dehydrogenase
MAKQSKNDSRPRVVIVGGSFAGLKTALNLPQKFNVTLIGKHPWFEFRPNIHELVSGIKTPAMMRFSNKAIVRRIGHRFLSGTVTQIVPEKKQVITASGKKLLYDYCVVATGGVTNTFGVQGAEKYALPFKSVAQCQLIGQTLKKLSKIKRPFHIVIVGGGIEGIEALGEILRGFRKHDGLRIRIIERAANLLPEAPADVESEIKEHCRPYSFECLTGVVVKKITPKTVLLSNGRRLRSDATIWTGGVKPNPILSTSGFTNTPDEWAPVKDSLQHDAYETVFFAGDAARVSSVHSKQAYHAIDMGICAAENIIRLNAGKAVKPFKPSGKPTIVSFGDLDSFVIVGKIVIAGSALNGLKEVVFQVTMTEFDPSGLVMKALHLSNRAGKMSLRKGLPFALSPSAMLKLKNVRILSQRSKKNE